MTLLIAERFFTSGEIIIKIALALRQLRGGSLVRTNKAICL